MRVLVEVLKDVGVTRPAGVAADEFVGRGRTLRLCGVPQQCDPESGNPRACHTQNDTEAEGRELCMSREFTLVPQDVSNIRTRFRHISTKLPVPESIPILQKLYDFEPRAMRGQPPVVWDRAEGFQVYDAWGNCWIDWSSGVLIANAGHGRPEIADAIARQASSHLLTSFNFANEPRARLVERLTSLLPEPLKKVFLTASGPRRSSARSSCAAPTG